MGLHDSIKTLKGIGPKKASYLKNMKIETLADLLYFLPREYEDRREIKSISSLADGETTLVRATLVMMAKSKYSFHRKQTLKLLVKDHTGSMEVLFFNASYLEKTLKPNQPYSLYGRVSIRNGKIQMIHPEISPYQGDSAAGILPIYPLTRGISQGELRKWQEEAIERNLETFQEYLPEEIVDRNRLCSLPYAIENIHFPKDGQRLKEAKYRLVFEELLFLQTGLLLIRNKFYANKNGIVFSNEHTMEPFIENLPYCLTNAQARVLREVNQDMESGKVMNRLIQGDVGSGKTAVAAAALYKAVKSGYQGVLMAPTEILARQHFEGLRKEFAKHDIRVGFLAGSLQPKEKRAVLAEIAQGELDIIIGTHALIQPNVQFHNLGLVITDEQHRFGVNQRSILSEKGKSPDILVMTATPIPRSLAFILYGDLDISIIDELPPGRQRIITRAVSGSQREEAYEFLKREVEKGQQAYIVAPLIEDSEVLDVRSASGLFEELQVRFNHLNLALLHGGMKQAEKDDAMDNFNKGLIDILISTVVIEVGINVPNATVMLIENAERFGLAQLHQLRGRVGRGSEQSYCVLVTEEKTKEAKERAEIMVSSNDGFYIAEKDLALRGPGEFFGTRQHGVPELKIADLTKHIKILNKVRNEAVDILEKDPFLSEKEHLNFKEKIEEMFKDVNQINL